MFSKLFRQHLTGENNFSRSEHSSESQFLIEPRRKGKMRRATFYSVVGDVASPVWIEECFQKCECMQFIQDPHDSHKCGCGRDKAAHDPMPSYPVGVWSWKKHSIAFPTDSYGALEFPTGVHAHYLRMSPNARPDDIVHLLVDQWGADPPKLIVSIHGGMSNFDLPTRVKRAFRRSLQRMAAVPGCWIITSGLNSGAAKHVGDALTAGVLRRNRTVVLGIVPWGVVAGRNRLLVRNGDVQYYPPPTAPGSTVLNPNHSAFLLVDDGTIGKYGSELRWRQEFENQISSPNRESNTPFVSVFVEGGSHCIRIAAEYLTADSEKPIVLVADSGRACDILSMAINLTDSNIAEANRSSGAMSIAMSDSDLAIISASIEQSFGMSQHRNRATLNEVILCTKRRKLVTIWTAPDSAVDPNSSATPDELDVCILSALLKTKQRSAPEQLRLALAWNRVDLANNLIFTEGQSWPDDAMEQSMMEALAMDRVEFVKLLLEQGVDMYEVLTYQRLEQLYNIKHSDSWRLRDITRLLLKRQFVGKMTLAEVGAAVDALMGFGYRSNYKARARLLQQRLQQGGKKHPTLTATLSSRNRAVAIIPGGDPERFRYPFSELLIWAVLMQRQNMARLMCSQGEEMLAKCLVACRLYRSMAVFIQPDVTSEIIVQLKKNAKDFSALAVELLERCRQLDEVMSQRLLTYELGNFSQKTCLSLAVSASMKHLVAHPCCQNLLDVLWMGGLRTRSTRPWKILLGIIFPPFAIFGLKYLSQEELNLQPQTEAEIEQRLHDSGSRTGSGQLSPAGALYTDDPAIIGRTSHFYSVGGSSFRSANPSRPRVTTYGSVHSTESNATATPALGKIRSGSNANKDSRTVQLPPVTTSSTFQQQSRPTTSNRYLPTVTSSASLTSSFSNLKRQRLSIMADLDAKVDGTPLSFKTRFDEFYNAPVTKYWLHSIGYVMFILCYCNTILTESSVTNAKWPEVYICIYVITQFLDKCREVASIDAHSIAARFQIYFSDIWNIFDATGVNLFIIGLALRWHADTFEAGRAFWIVAIVFYLVHIFDIFQANQDIATYIMILTKMLKKMFSFLIILGVVVATYGIVLQATRFPFREPEWAILKDIFVEPYLNLYGETYHEFVDTGKCDSEDKHSLDREKPPCWCCTWIGPLAQTCYLIIANIAMLNLLVAVFNSVYEKVNNVSQALTRFQRYRLIVDYQLLPTLPPPFIIFSHLYILGRALIRYFRGRPFRARDPGLLKVVLSEADIASLHDFEEQAGDELLEQREIATSRSSPEEQMRATAERMEAVQAAVEQIVQRQAAVLNAMRDFEVRMMSMKSEVPQSPVSLRSPLEKQMSFLAPVAKIKPEQDEAEESSRSALGPRLFRRLRVVSVREEDREYTQAARDLLATVKDLGVSGTDQDMEANQSETNNKDESNTKNNGNDADQSSEDESFGQF